MPFLSIVVPVFNKEAYIDSCVKSILNQTFRDFELILINDGSTDGSGLKCDHYAKLDNRVSVFHQENKGVSQARNTGIGRSEGAYVGFVDSDDFLDEDMYEILVRNALDTSADISLCGVRMIGAGIGNNQKVQQSPRVEILNNEEALSAALIGKFSSGVYNKIIKAAIAKQIKFEGIINEDVFYNIRAFLAADRTVFQNVIKYNYIPRPNSITMAQFDLRFMETIYTSKKVLTVISAEKPALLDDARVFDFTKNISLLNLFLLSGIKKNSPEYQQVCSNLNNYRFFLKQTNKVTKKQKYAYYLFRINATVYSWLMRLYSLKFAKHLIKITNK